MWTLTVMPSDGGWVETIDGLIHDCAVATPAACATTYGSGAQPTVRARTSNGSGMHFVGWAGPPTCADAGAVRTCTLNLNAANQPIVVQPMFAVIEQNLAFVSSAKVPASLGGLTPYDTLCNALASDAGINDQTGTAFVAWMSTFGDTRANQRFTATGGVTRVDGRPVAFSRADLLAGLIRYPLSLDEWGQRIPPSTFAAGDDAVWTGTTSSGNSTSDDCAGWTVASANRATIGAANGGPGLWTDDRSSNAPCSDLRRVFCLQNTSSVVGTFPALPPGAKRLFRTPKVNNPTSLADADATCQQLAQQANLIGPADAGYRALLADTTESAAEHARLINSTDYWRVDGVRVATGFDLKRGVLASGLWALPDGGCAGAVNELDPGEQQAWTGADAPTNSGTITSTCNNWAPTVGNISAQLGNSRYSSLRYFVDFGVGAACDPTTTTNANVFRGLYCIEQ
ncbi:MAG: hypothetical protein JNG84_09615 [Archangium sp.]|nr:hypothetical protein [Archangium sp.]